ncbi:DUF2339 domain-containing protein [Phycisphaeraceae bacterium D3-23]
MSEILVVSILFVLLLLAAVVALGVFSFSLAGRLSATQGRMTTLERQHLRHLDVLSGRLGRLEEAAAAARPSAGPATPQASQPESGSSAGQVEASDVPWDGEELIKPAELNASLAAFRRAKEKAQAADAHVATNEKGEEVSDRGADIPVGRSAQPKGAGDAGSPQAAQGSDEPLEELQPVTGAHAACSDTAGLGPVADKNVCPTKHDARPTKSNVGPTVGASEPPARSGLSGLSFEQLLGGKVFVWLGAIALVLTGAFLLKYGIDNYTISDAARVILAGVFGCVMVGGAFGLRRRSAGIAEALCAAGVAVLFGTIYAGQNMYGLLPPALGYTLLVLVTASAVVLSLRFGPLVALLGLVGGFALPPLLGAETPGRPAMVVYLLALELGVLAVTRKRGWMGISVLTMLGWVIWSLSYVVFGSDSAMDRGFTAVLIMATAVIFVLNAAFAQQREPGKDASKVRQTLWLALGAAGSAAAMLALLVIRNGYTTQDLVMLWVMTAGALVLARLNAKYMPIAWVASGLSAVVVLGAGVSAWWGEWLSFAAVDLRVLYGGALAFGLLVGVGGYAAQWWPARRRGFALMAALAGPAFLGIAVVGGGVLGIGQLSGLREGWWLWSLGVALAYALAAWPLVWRGVLRPGAHAGAQRGDDIWSASAFGLASIVLGTLAVAQGLNHPWLAVGWALLGALAAVLGWQLRLIVLTYASAALAALSAVLLVVPGPFTIETGSTIVFNVLLIVYALAALAYGVTAYAAHRAGQAELSRPLQGLALGALAVGCVVLVRHGFHPEAFRAPAVFLYEWPTYAVVLLAVGLGAGYLARRLGLVTVGLVAACAGMFGAALSIAGPVLFGNPVLYAEVSGGGSLAFGMLYLYALPAVGVYLLACSFERSDEEGVAFALRGGAVLLGCVFVLMQVRNGYNWTDLRHPRVGFYERGTYGLALLGLAWVLFSYARVVGSGFAKRAGRAVAAAGMGVSLGVMLVVGNPLLDTALDGGRWLVFGLCFAYVIPAVLGWLYARAIDPEASWPIGRFLRLGAIALTTACVGLQVRNGFHLDNLHAFDITRFEWATYGLVWMALGALFALAGRWLTDRSLLRRAGLCVALLGIGSAMLGTLLIDNPLWTRQGVGALPIANGLWYLYGPTILALAVLARRLRRAGLRAEAHAVGGGAIAVGFFLLSLLVRQGFSADGVLTLTALPSGDEWYAYSLAWVVLGLGLLVAGVLSGLDTLRYGSLAVMLLAVAKVFALDTAQLSGLLRVFSFLGLGITLLLLGYTYQRFVFRKPAPDDEQAVDSDTAAIQA